MSKKRIFALSGVMFCILLGTHASAAPVGGYQGEQAIAFGVARAANENLRFNAKMLFNLRDASRPSYGVGVSYDF